MDNQQLRTRIKKQRAALTDNEIKHKSDLIANQLHASTQFIEAKHVAYYLPVSGEADPTSLFTGKTDKKELYLPVLKQAGATGLHFIKVHKATLFETNKYGIQEPVGTSNDLIEAEELDLVIAPLVSFDRQGNRVGMGGGFYDRTFAFKQSLPIRKPLLIGYAYDFQCSDTLTPESWDVKLDGVVTESGLTLF
ncbi:MAG: 5-formyltetrahydrofolate cyclo-ligase [Thiotrichaceae bacterium]